MQFGALEPKATDVEYARNDLALRLRPDSEAFHPPSGNVRKQRGNKLHHQGKQINM